MSRRVVYGARSVVLEAGERVIPYRQHQPRCSHQQAEPVVLSTGETVACVCISCIEPLAANWIANQRSTAERVAYCRHEDLVDITGFGKVETDYICAGCGAMNP
jgi:hypothetical protein